MAQNDLPKDGASLQRMPPITMTGISPEEYFQRVVISALLNILHDNALSSLYFGVVEVIMTIFKTQGMKCMAFLPQVRAIKHHQCCRRPYTILDRFRLYYCNSVSHPSSPGLLPTANSHVGGNRQISYTSPRQRCARFVPRSVVKPSPSFADHITYRSAFQSFGCWF